MQSLLPLNRKAFNYFIAKNHPNLTQLPGPNPTFPLGNLLDFIKLKPWELVDYYHNCYGKLFKAWLGPIPVVFVLDYKGAEQIFIDDTVSYIKQEPSACLMPTLGASCAFNTNGSIWARNRKNNFLTDPRIIEFFNKNFSFLSQKIPVLMSKHALFEADQNFQQKFTRFLMDCFSLVVTSEELPSAIADSFHQMSIISDLSIKINLPIITPGFLLYRSRWHKFWEEIVKKSSYIQESDTTGIVHFLLQGSHLDHASFARELGNVFWGGMFSVQAVLLNTFFHLYKNPNVLNTFFEATHQYNRNEQCVHFSKNEIIEGVLRESLRVTPPVPLYGRTVIAKETELLGHKIFQGTKVFFSCRPFHFDSEVWDSPQTFNPQRWNTENLKKHHYQSENFMPFGLGPRSCIGQDFALYLIRTILVNTLRIARPHFNNQKLDFDFFFGCQIPKKLNGHFILRDTKKIHD